MKRYLAKRLTSIGFHLKERTFTAVIVAGIGITGYGTFSLELATTIAGLALIMSGAIGLVMSLQTSSISISLHERFDKQDGILKSIQKDVMKNHKEIMKNHEETMKNHEETMKNHEENTKNHQEVMDGLKEMTVLLKEILKALQKIDKKLDN